MRRHSFRAGFLLAIISLLAGAALVACSSSGTSSSDKTATAAAASSSGGAATKITGGAATKTAGDAPTESTQPTEAPTTASSSSSSSATLPSDACTLLTNDEASTLAGAAVTGNTGKQTTAVYQGGTTSPCDFYGPGGTGDHPVHVWVTSFASADAAHTFIQGETNLYKIGQGFKTPSGIGDEAIESTIGGMAGVQARVGSLVVQLNAGSRDYPAPDSTAMENAVKAIIGRL